jgi:hypothetical protein
MDDTVLVNSITSLQPGADELLYVTMRGDGRVTVLTPDGALVRRTGGQGEGPGEFVGINGLGWRNDSLWVMDAQLGRLSWFDARGAFLGSERQPVRHLRPTSSGGLIGLEVRWVEATSLRLESQARGQPNPATVKRVAWQRGGFRIPLGGGTTRVGSHPLSDRPLAANHPQGEGLVLAELPESEGPVTLSWFSATGAVKRQHRVQLDAPVLTETAWREFLNGYFNPPLAPDMTDDKLDGVLARPARWPPISRLLLSADNRVWIRGPAIPGADVTWTIFDSLATRLGSITLPANLRLMSPSGDTVWSIQPNADDLDIVTRHLLRH